MAQLLSRLGRFSARRAWAVIVGWIVLLGLAGGAFLTFGGSLASSFSIPGTATERVNDQLVDEFPDLAGATGSVVFTTDDTSGFTAAQRNDIAALLERVGAVAGVSDTIDPFEAEQQRSDQAERLADGTKKIEDGRARLDAAEEQAEAGRKQLDAAIAQAEAAGAYDAAAPRFDQKRSEIDASLDAIAEKRSELDERSTTLERAHDLMRYADGVTTVSQDGTTAVASVVFIQDLFDLPESVTERVATLLDGAEIPGVGVDYSATIATTIGGLLGVGEIIGIAIAAIVLLVMMRALLPALTPLISSGLGVGVGVAGALALSGAVDMATVTPVLGVMLGLAVGIDYALFILHRHRRQVLAGMEVRESVALANGTAGNAVVFAGSTVVVALAALTVTGIPFLTVMGLVAAACVVVAVLVSVTFTPAILGLLGTRVLGRRQRARIGHPDHTPKPITPRNTIASIGSVVLAVVALLAVAVPALSMRLGLPDGASDATDSTQYRAYKTIESEFGAGMNGPLVVLATTPHSVSEDDEVAVEQRIAEVLHDQDDVAAVVPVGVADSRHAIAFQVVPTHGPNDESTSDLVHELRALSPLAGDVDLGVAGQASGNIDVSEKLAEALPVYLAVVIGLSLVIMILVFRSLLVPLIATGGYVLSLFAALGATTAVYQWGWLSSIFDVHDPGPILSFAPILLMGVLFGLAMDYQLFIVSGMREAYAHGVPARNAVVAGMRGGRAVVTAAAIIMGSVFGGFVFSELSMIRPLGFGLAVGVLLDAFVVRMVIVPALMHLLGRRAWWLPRGLDRILPNVDVEGAGLEHAGRPSTAEVVEEPTPAREDALV